jgi:hypothetical protein
MGDKMKTQERGRKEMNDSSKGEGRQGGNRRTIDKQGWFELPYDGHLTCTAATKEQLLREKRTEKRNREKRAQMC